MHIVTLRRQREYGMPGLCCACGATAGAARLAVSTDDATSLRRRVIELHFPLCDSCAQVHGSITRCRAIAALVGTWLSAALCGAGFLVPSIVPAASSNAFAWLTEACLLAAVAALIGMLIYRDTRALDAGDGSRDVYRRTVHAVKIRHVGIAMRRADRAELVRLSFGNDDFGRLFRRMNTAVVWTDRPPA